MQRKPSITHCLSVTLAICALASCGGSSYDAMVEEANAEGQPLIIEFYADWCRPCNAFEKQVLSRSDVKKALGSVTFRRYDFDTTAGKHHARRLNIKGVPSFVAVGSDGMPYGGLRGAVSASRFLEFLKWSRDRYTAGNGAPKVGHK